MITVDHERGVYIYDSNGVKTEYPRITRILSPVMDHRATDYALNRGRLVHDACRILDSGEGRGLHWDSLDPELRPRVEAYADFKQQASVMAFNLIETPLISFKCLHVFLFTIQDIVEMQTPNSFERRVWLIPRLSISLIVET